LRDVLQGHEDVSIILPNQYRVIYGDLHAETITSEKLAELEANLPK